jgi:hypothetical protein
LTLKSKKALQTSGFIHNFDKVKTESLRVISIDEIEFAIDRLKNLQKPEETSNEKTEQTQREIIQEEAAQILKKYLTNYEEFLIYDQSGILGKNYYFNPLDYGVEPKEINDRAERLNGEYRNAKISKSFADEEPKKIDADLKLWRSADLDGIGGKTPDFTREPLAGVF